MRAVRAVFVLSVTQSVKQVNTQHSSYIERASLHCLGHVDNAHICVGRLAGRNVGQRSRSAPHVLLFSVIGIHVFIIAGLL